MKCSYYCQCPEWENEKVLCTAVYKFCKRYKEYERNEMENLRNKHESELELGADQAGRRIE